MEWFLKVVRDNYANFEGRARRKEYWMFFLFNVIFAFAAAILDNVLGLSFEGIGYGFIYLAYALALFIPGLAVAVRRLHDTGKSGWWLLLAFIPLAGIVILVFMCLDSQPGQNEYGPNPKNVGDGFNSSDMAIDENI
ncbi:MAG: DUF805 domain-containing protein [Flavobacteriales bacterium]